MRSRKLFFTLSLAILAGCILYAMITASEANPLEIAAFRLVNTKAANPVLDAIMPVVTDLDRWRIVFVAAWIILAMLGGKKGRWAAIALIPLIAASDQISSGLIKPLVQRARPCEVLGQVHLWYGQEGWITTPEVLVRSYKATLSFPSGHAANITAAMVFLGLLYRKILAPLASIAAIVCFSRIYIGVHWPSDVLAGAALGSSLALIACSILERSRHALGGLEHSR